ncbi:MAG: hypothetical protein WCL18_01405 [bacterium]
MYGEMQRRFTEDRLNSNQETKYLNKEKKYCMGPLLDALSAVDILVIDDFDAFS